MIYIEIKNFYCSSKKVFWIHWPQVSKLFHAQEKCTQVLGSLLWWLTALLQGLILLTFTWSSEDHMHFSLFRRYMYFIVAIKFAKLCMENVSDQLLLSLLPTHSLSLSLEREKDRENHVRVIYYPVVYKENVGKILQRYIQGEPNSVVSAKNTCTTFSN